MAEEKKKSKAWPRIGTLRRGDSGSYIKLEANVSIMVDGIEVPLNDKRTVRLEDPRKKVENLLERGIITEAEHDKRLESLANNEWLRYELIVPPPRTEK
jgi:hypothetical protein